MQIDDEVSATCEHAGGGAMFLQEIHHLLQARRP